jgi:drug/metabolite transporter (DMT)-like permease
MAGFALSDMWAKGLAASFSPFLLAWFRYLGLFAMVLPLVLARPALLRTAQPHLQVLRAMALVGSAVFFLCALRAIPQAEATAMVFASPLFVMLLARLVLRERAGLRRWLPVLCGFAGVLVVARPGRLAFGGAEIFPILSSMSWACAVVLTRSLSAREHAATTVLYSAAIGTLGLSLLLPAIEWPAVGAAAWRLALMSLSWCAAQWLVLVAYRIAPPSVIAPFSYSQMLWAALLGGAVFGHWPDATSWAGMGLIALGGLYAAFQARSAWRR